MSHKDLEARRAYNATYGKAWRAANKERKAAYNAAYRAANKERIAAREAARYVLNRDRILAKQVAERKRRMKTPEHIECERAWRDSIRAWNRRVKQSRDSLRRRERYTTDAEYRQRLRDQSRKRYINKPAAARERDALYHKAWRAANKERKAANDAAYAAAHREKIRAYKAAYQVANRARATASNAAHRARNDIAALEALGVKVDG